MIGPEWDGGLTALPMAFAAGVLAGVNPCCVPIYPAAAGCCAALRKDSVAANVGLAFAFVLGGCVTTTGLGIAAGLAGRAFGPAGALSTYAVGALLIVSGLHLVGAVRIPVPTLRASGMVARGPLGAAAAGATLSFVVAPCSTPVLGGLLAYVAATADPWTGGMLLFTYGLGLGVPLFLLGTAAAAVVSRLGQGRQKKVADAVAGSVLIGLGLYFVWIA